MSAPTTPDSQATPIRTVEERAARLREIYEADCAILGIPPYDSPLEAAMARSISRPGSRRLVA